MRAALMFFTYGILADAATTAIGSLLEPGYERNPLVNAISLPGTLGLTALLGAVVVAVLNRAQSRPWITSLLIAVGISRWFAATIAGLGLAGVLR